MVAFTDKVSPYISPMTLAVFEDRSVNAPPRHCLYNPHTLARIAPRTQFMRHLRSESHMLDSCAANVYGVSLLWPSGPFSDRLQRAAAGTLLTTLRRRDIARAETGATSRAVHSLHRSASGATSPQLDPRPTSARPQRAPARARWTGESSVLVLVCALRSEKLHIWANHDYQLESLFYLFHARHRNGDHMRHTCVLSHP